MTQLRRDANGLAILPRGARGDVILSGRPRCTTLLPFHAALNSSSPASEGQEGGTKRDPRPRRYAPGRGQRGCYRQPGAAAGRGRHGRTLRIPVPVGTVVKKKHGGKLWRTWRGRGKK